MTWIILPNVNIIAGDAVVQVNGGTDLSAVLAGWAFHNSGRVYEITGTTTTTLILASDDLPTATLNGVSAKIQATAAPLEAGMTQAIKAVTDTGEFAINLFGSLAELATTPATSTIPIIDAAGTQHNIPGFIGNWHTGNFDPASKQDADDAKLHAMTQAEFFAGIERNNNLYACSGSVEYGKAYLTDGAWGDYINQGLFAPQLNTAYSDMLLMGSASSGGAGTSKTGHAIKNINGVLHNLSHINSSDGNLLNKIKSPPAPDGKKTYDSANGTVTEHLTPALAFAAETDTNKVITSRKDFVFIESFHELLDGPDGSDIFSPEGNVQWGASTYNGMSLSQDLIAQGYSAFGVWDTTTKSFQKVWSSMTPQEQKIAFADPLNNMYITDEGYTCEVKFRVRVIEGLGNEWGKLSPKATGDASARGATMHSNKVSGNEYIQVQGANTSLLTDITNTNQYGFFVTKDKAAFHEGVDQGLWIGAGGTNAKLADTTAHNGLCFAIPLCLVQRLNQGAYHPSFNAEGTGRQINEASSGWVDWFASTAKIGLAKADFFISVGDGGLVDAAGTVGSIAGGGVFSGRPDAKFYDAIYASQVTDLRLQAHEPTPTQLEPNYWMNRAVADDHKNYVMEGAPRLVVKERGVVETQSTISGAGYALQVGSNANFSIGEFAIFLNQNNIVIAKGYIGYSTASSIALATTFTASLRGGYTENVNRTNGDIYTILKVEYSTATTQEITRTDIIGDPSNYPRQATGVIDHLSSDGTQTIKTGQSIEIIAGSTGGAEVGNIYIRLLVDATFDLALINGGAPEWLDLGPKAQFLANATGMDGFPLLFGENGEDLIPDGTSKYFKLSRKCTESFGVAWSGDAGVSWTKHTAWNAAMESSANGRTEAELAGNVYLLPYKTPAHVFTDDVNSEVGGSKLGDVYAMDNADGDGAGAKLSSELIGKVATGTGGMASTAQYTVLSKRIDFRTGKLYTAPVTHPTINLDGTGPAAKALPYISRDNAQGKLLLVSKEMIYDTTRDSLAEVDVVSNTGTTATWTTNQLVHFARDDAGVLSRQILRAVDNGSGFSSSALQNFYMDAQGNFIWSNGTAYFKKVDLGWGDNNEFIVGDNTTTFTDENGNTGLASTKSTVLPIIIRK